MKPTLQFFDLSIVCTSPVCNYGKMNNLNTKSSKMLTPNRQKTFLAFAMLMIAMLCNDISLAWIHDRVPTDTEPLPDVWFSLFPEYTPAIEVLIFQKTPFLSNFLSQKTIWFKRIENIVAKIPRRKQLVQHRTKNCHISHIFIRHPSCDQSFVCVQPES